ncbi:MAG: DUF6049 family protein, partial [Acidimicrobiales bacterium]
VLLGASVAWLPAAPAAGATGGAPLRLLAQSPWTGSGQTFAMRVAVGATVAPGDHLELAAYPRLTTRSGFDTTLSGRITGAPVWGPSSVPIARLVGDPAGGFDLAIPVDTASTGTDLPTFSASNSAGPGVFPLQLQVFDPAGRPVGSPLTTFLVFSASPAAMAGLAKLSVSLSVAVHAAPALGAGELPTKLGAGVSGQLSALAGVLAAHPAVPLSLAVTPQTAAALAAGGLRDRATLQNLTGLIGAGDQLLPATYVATSMPALVASGLGGEVAAQVQAGAAALAVQLHHSPGTKTWVVNGPLDAATAADLAGLGMTRLIVPGADLAAVPPADRRTTFALPGPLVLRNGPRLAVAGADDGLAAHFTNGPGQVLRANQLLAELSMIQLEAPGQIRGVAILPPAAWSENSAFLGTLLTGLTGNPLLSPVTARGLFAAVPFGSAGRAAVTRSFATARGPRPLPDAAALRAARRQVAAFSAILAADRGVSARLADQLLLAESADLTGRSAQAVLARLDRSTRALEHQITLPGSSSVTLTARQGAVPLTVLSDGLVRAHVQLRLSSPKLIFHPFAPPGGRCEVSVPTAETCDLTLAANATTFKIPVEARTSGVFALSVALWSPDGSLMLASNRDTVRSTAASGVGVVLIVGAALFLSVWWIRNFRHGRRARQLIDPPDPDSLEEEETSPTALPSPSPAPREPTGETVSPLPDEGWLDDRVIAEFFANPPPPYPGRTGS